MIFVNFKTYKESSGESAISLAKIISRVADESGIEIIACPQEADFEKVRESVNHPVWVQHVDTKLRGKTTGWFPPEVAKELGAEGTFLNHSEHKLSMNDLEETVLLCKKVDLKTLIFAANLEEAKEVAKLKPDFVGYEPPELVGSRETSVASQKPDVIEKVVETVTPLKVIVGAGIHLKKDVEVSLSLGAFGVALATDVVLADDPEKELAELVEGFKK